MMYPFEARFAAFIKHLEKASPCLNREQAYALVRRTWVEVNASMGAPEEFLRMLEGKALCAEHGWHDLDQRACYWDCRRPHPIRIYLHEDGSIVVQSMRGDVHEILLALPGAAVSLQPR